jgi:hypothetical protein
MGRDTARPDGGLQLVRVLAKQLAGTVAFQNAGETIVDLHRPK